MTEQRRKFRFVTLRGERRPIWYEQYFYNFIAPADRALMMTMTDNEAAYVWGQVHDETPPALWVST